MYVPSGGLKTSVTTARQRWLLGPIDLLDKVQLPLPAPEPPCITTTGIFSAAEAADDDEEEELKQGKIEVDTDVETIAATSADVRPATT